MFNLNQAIAEWRRQMRSAGIKTPVPLDELESHLRDEVEQRMRSGSNARQAFDIAIDRIGQSRALKEEFTKAAKDRGTAQKFMAVICLALVGFIFWMSGYTFFKLELSPAELIVAFAAVAFALLAACVWRYAVPLLPVVTNKRKRRAIVLGCFVAGFVCSNLFCQFILPHFERSSDHQIPAIGFWAVFPIALFLGLGCALEEAARTRPTS